MTQKTTPVYGLGVEVATFLIHVTVVAVPGAAVLAWISDVPYWLWLVWFSAAVLVGQCTRSLWQRLKARRELRSKEG